MPSAIAVKVTAGNIPTTMHKHKSTDKSLFFIIATIPLPVEKCTFL